MRVRIFLSKPTNKDLMLHDKLSLDKKIFHNICGLGYNDEGDVCRITIDMSEGEMFV